MSSKPSRPRVRASKKGFPELKEAYWKEPSPKRQGIPGADILVLSSTNEKLKDEELEPQYLETYRAASLLEEELVQVIQSIVLDAASKRVIIQTLRAYGAARERHGALAAEFEFREVHQHHSALVGQKRGEGRRKHGAREPRLVLLVRWIEINFPHIETHQALYGKKDEAAKWLKLQDPRVPLPADRKTWNDDFREAFNRLKANRVGPSK